MVALLERRKRTDMADELSKKNQDPTELATRVRDVLELMRPMIQEDDGDIEFVEVTDEGVVRIRFLGACVGCPSSSHTLHQGIERLLKERIEEVTGVEAQE
jgi:Fe-S cluster biogenesis protein NfuA